MRHPATSQRGNAILEFAIAAPLLVGMLLGVFTTGMAISKSQQVSTLAHEAGSMFVRFVDFSSPGNQAMLLRQANNLDLRAEGGKGVIVLSQMKKISEPDCRAAGFDPRKCPNLGYTVVVKRQFVGNRALFRSPYGSPQKKLLEQSGVILAVHYLFDPSCRAEQFESVLMLSGGEVAYLSEAFFRTPDLDIPGYKKDSSIYRKVVF